MPLIVLFIFGAVVIGAGAMLAPAWRTAQPRIGLNAALALALIMGGSLFLGSLFGWDTLTVDYLLFALVTSIFLFGTLSFGQKRAEDRGEELADDDQGWPGPTDLLLFAVAGILFVVPALVLPVPLDTDAQGFGYLALAVREGGTFTTLAPFHPEIEYLYAPGFLAIAAYLSEQLAQPLHSVQIGVGAVLSLVIVLLAYDFGAEWRDKRLGRALAIAAIIGVGLFTAYMDSHYTTLLALVFAFAFLIYAYRYLRDGGSADAIAAGLLLGAVILSHPDTTIILALGYVPWLASMWLGHPRPTLRRWLVLLACVPLLALLAVSPWLFSIRALLGSEIASPFGRDPAHIGVMVLYHGVLIVILAAVGLLAGLRRREQPVLLAAGWLLLVLDAAAFGVIDAVFGWLLEPILRYEYPFSIAWHGPIIPYILLGGCGLLWLWDRFAEARFGVPLQRLAPYALIAVGGLGLLAGALSEPLLQASKGRVAFYGAFASAADVAAMTWLRTSAQPDARVLNYGAPHEADWAPVIAERDTVYYRPQPFFRGDEASLAEQERLLAFWRNPADPAHETLLRQAGIDYVLVPQIVGNPDSLASLWRWREPFRIEAASSVEEADYLRLVFDLDGARVYELRPETAQKQAVALAPASGRQEPSRA
jgi:hypothetical protein